MQKLLSMFPRGAPGIALLMLRLPLASALISDTAIVVSALNGHAVYLTVACALAVIVGLATPIAAVLTALIEMFGLNAHVGDLASHSFAPIVIGVALALLVPALIR
jgi:hypothetical protein